MADPIVHHENIVAPEASPERWCLFLHGIYGAGRNWGSVARSLVRRRPEWGAVLVDLRQHGASRGFTPPHTLSSAAGDLAALCRSEQVCAAAVVGHSFGGKVALQYAAAYAAGGLEHVFIVDSTPAPTAEGGSAWSMLQVLRALPQSFGSRAEAVAQMVQRGIAEPVAQWMATNLERRGDALGWRFDLEDMEALLRGFFQADLWSVVENPPDDVQLHFIRASESSVLGEDAARRIRKAGEANGRVSLHVVEGGHWLNADNPAAIESLLAATL